MGRKCEANPRCVCWLGRCGVLTRAISLVYLSYARPWRTWPQLNGYESTHWLICSSSLCILHELARMPSSVCCVGLIGGCSHRSLSFSSPVVRMTWLVFKDSLIGPNVQLHWSGVGQVAADCKSNGRMPLRLRDSLTSTKLSILHIFLPV